MRDKSKPDTLVIAGQKILPGQSMSIRLPTPKLYTYTPVDIPIHIINSNKAGPRLFVCASIHGDEISGVEIIRRLLKSPAIKHLVKGTLIAIPVVNIYGFINQSRYLPDRRDLNRSFPGKKMGSLASQLARLFLDEVIKHCTCGIDLHSGALHRWNLPQIRVNLQQPDAERLAKAFAAPVILDANLRDGSLREVGDKLNIPILVYEGGEALRFHEISIRKGLQGILHVMEKLGMIHKKNNIPKTHSIIARSSKWVRAPCSGITKPLKLLGKKVKKGEQLTTISDPFGETETSVLAQHSGIVIGYSTLPLIHAGEALFHIAYFKKMKELSKQLDELQSWYTRSPENGYHSSSNHNN